MATSTPRQGGDKVATRAEAPMDVVDEKATMVGPESMTAEGGTQTASTPLYLSGYRLWAIVGCLTLVFFLVLLDTSIIATAVPRITSDFHSLGDVGWYGSAYQLASASFQPLTGKIYARFSSKWVFLAFFAVFELGSVICGAAQSSAMFIAGRVVAGLGCSGLQNGALTIIVDVVELKKRPVYTGFLIAFAQLGIISGPLIGGAITEYSTWRWCFWLNLPAGAVTAGLLIVMPLTASRPKTTTDIPTLLSELDLVGFLIFCPSVVLLLLALQWGGADYAWSSATVIGLLCAAPLLFLLFILWERHKGDEAMIPLKMVRIRIFWTSCAYGVVLMGSLLSAAYYLPIYFQAVKGDNPFQSGFHTLPGILSQLVFGIISAVAVTKFNYYLPWTLSAGILNVVGNALLSTLSAASPTREWAGYQAIVGAGRGAGLQMSIIAVQNHLSQEQMPVAMSTLVFSQNLGAAVFICLSNTLLNGRLRSVIAEVAPSLAFEKVAAAGGSAAGVEALVAANPELDLGQVRHAFSEGVNRVFVTLAGISGLLILLSPGMGLRTRKEETKDTQN